MVLIGISVGVLAFIIGFVNVSPQSSWKELAIGVGTGTVLATILGVVFVFDSLLESLLVALVVAVAIVAAAPLGAKTKIRLRS